VEDTISGIVIDSVTKSPITQVTVASEGLSTSTDANGSFRLTFPSTAIMRFEQSGRMYPENGSFSLGGFSGDVSVQVRNVQGSLVAQFSSNSLGKTRDGFRFSPANLPQGIYMVVIKTLGQTNVYKVANIASNYANSFSILGGNNFDRAAGALSKVSATIKTHILTFTKTGYASKTDTVASGAQTAITVNLSESSSSVVKFFDGKTLNGWIPVAANNWKVNTADTAIQCTGAGRGYIYTTNKYLRYRAIYQVRNIIAPGGGAHKPCVLFFGQDGTYTMTGGVQLQLPAQGTWDYRPGVDLSADKFVTKYAIPAINYTQWAQCELLVDTRKGTAIAAVAQPPGTKATKSELFYDPAVKTYNPSPLAFEAHNGGVNDEYKDITIEENPTIDSLITTR